jgi:hypothetical protein
MGLILELSNDITVWLPFGVTLGAIALAGSLALVVLAMRARSDALLRRAASRSARAEARFQKEAAIVSADPGALFVWRNIGGEPIARTGAASVLAGVLDADEKGELQDALTTLGTGGSMFSMTVPGSDGRVFQAYGKPTAGQAALWLRDVTPDAESNYNLTVRLTASEEERAWVTCLMSHRCPSGAATKTSTSSGRTAPMSRPSIRRSALTSSLTRSSSTATAALSPIARCR